VKTMELDALDSRKALQVAISLHPLTAKKLGVALEQLDANVLTVSTALRRIHQIISIPLSGLEVAITLVLAMTAFIVTGVLAALSLQGNSAVLCVCVCVCVCVHAAG
jgi:hypothetical protein